MVGNLEVDSKLLTFVLNLNDMKKFKYYLPFIGIFLLFNEGFKGKFVKVEHDLEIVAMMLVSGFSGIISVFLLLFTFLCIFQ